MSDIKSEKPFTVLGIDASLTGTGLCILTWDYINGKMPKTITLTNNLTGVPRLIYIEQEIAKWAKDADLIVIENYAYERKFKREVLGELQGVIKRRLYLMDKKTLIINTQKIKKILTGSGSKPSKYKNIDIKKWTVMETKKNYNIDFESRDNECDAFGLALIGLFLEMYKRNPKDLEKYPLARAIIKQIVNPSKKQSKKTLQYYCDLPFKICVYDKLNGTYEAYCPGLEYKVTGDSAQKAVDNLLKGKKDRIKEMKKKKIKIKTYKKYMGGISFIVEK
jgi:Holliday junction resolvasome RuvABC endonuclease subunit